MPTYAEDSLVSVTGTIVQTVTPSGTLGDVLHVTQDTLDGSAVQIFTSAAAAATALALSQISQRTHDMIVAALGQGVTRPGRVYAATYDPSASPTPETPADAIQAALNAGWTGAVIMDNLHTDAVSEAIASWIAADSQRQAQYLYIAQSDEAGLLTSGKPAGLADCQIYNVRMCYHSDDDEPMAGALAGITAGYAVQGGPIGARSVLRSVASDSANVTSAELAFLLDNDASAALEYGRTLSQVLSVGESAYDGSGWSGAVSLAYTCRRVREALASLWLRQAGLSRAIKADLTGRALAAGAVGAVLTELAQAGHYTPTEALPDGYSYSTRISGSGGSAQIVVDVTVQLGLEARSISVPVIGQEVTA